MSMTTLPPRALSRKSVPLTPSVALLVASLWLLVAAVPLAQRVALLPRGPRDRQNAEPS